MLQANLIGLFLYATLSRTFGILFAQLYRICNFPVRKQKVESMCWTIQSSTLLNQKTCGKFSWKSFPVDFLLVGDPWDPPQLQTSEASPCAAAACFARRRRAAPLVAERSGTGATLAGLSWRFLRRFWILEVGILESFQLLACYTFKYINKSQLAGHKDAQSFVLKVFSCRFLLDLKYE